MTKPILLVTRRLPPHVEARAARDYAARLTASDTPIPDIVARAAGASAIICCPGDQLDAATIGLSVDGNEVELSGKVRTWAERNEAERAAWSVPGVWRVDNHLQITVL